jgi:hypothetical protein
MIGIAGKTTNNNVVGTFPLDPASWLGFPQL